MNIFAVTYCLPPIQVPATMRLLKWFKGLTEMEHHITALAIDPASFGGSKDEVLLSLMPTEGITCRFAWSLEQSLLYRLMKKRANVFYRFLEPAGMGWYAPALRSVRSLDFEQYDLLFTCSSPHSCHLIGRKIKRATGIPWVAYFSDPWADNPLIAHRSRRIDKYNQYLEAQVFEEADLIVFTTPETIDLEMAKYNGRYRDKCRVLPHCFVPQWYNRSQARLQGNGSRIRILQAGSFYSDRSALPFLRAVRTVSDGGRKSMSFEVHIYGVLDPHSIEYIHRNGLDEIVHFGGKVPFLDSLALMKDADFLLLIDAPLKNHSESVFFPSKLIDYMGSGRPVIGVTPLRGASARVLRETGNFLCDLAEIHTIEETLEAINTGQLNPERNLSAIDKYHYRNVVGMLHKIFQELQ
jgi:hypothetical protein